MYSDLDVRLLIFVIRAMIAATLIFLSMVTFQITLGMGEEAGMVLALIAILWFPGAVVLASLLIPRVVESQNYLYWIAVVTAVICFLLEVLLAFVAPLFGLRFVNALIIIPAPPLPYELLRIPEIVKVFIQFAVSFVLAAVLFWLGMRLGGHESDTEKQ